MSNKLHLLADESLILILEFLRATDLCVCSEVDKKTFTQDRIAQAIKYQVENIYQIFTFTNHSPMKNMELPVLQLSDMRSDFLYVKEIKTIMAALNFTPSVTKGFWVSASWISNAKKYFEAMPLPDLNTRGPAKKGGKKLSKIRQRRGSDSLPPWPAINADITCAHGNLVASKCCKAKRKLVDKRVWYFLRKFYREGAEFKSTIVTECSLCLAQDSEARLLTMERKDAELSQRKVGVSESLDGLLSRKSGVPGHMLTLAYSGSNATTNTNTTSAAFAFETPTGDHSSVLRSEASSPSSTTLDQRWPLRSGSITDSVSGDSDNGDTTNGALDYGFGNAHVSLEEDRRLAERLQMQFDVQAFGMPIPEEEVGDTQLHHSAFASAASTSNSSVFASSFRETAFIERRQQQQQPLLPGMYHIISRSWLKKYRKYLKDSELKDLAPPDCTSFLCQTHGSIIIPPHVEEYLHGYRANLLGGLANYPGEVVEILTSDEFEALSTALGPLSPDFNVRFSLDGVTIAWSVEVCRACDPFNYRALRTRAGKPIVPI